MINKNTDNLDDFFLDDFEIPLPDLKNMPSAACDNSGEEWEKEYSFVPYESKGTTYNIPRAKGKARCKIGKDLRFAVDGYDFVSLLQDRNSLYIDGAISGRTLNFSLEDLNSYFSNEHLLVALYKEGCPNPLKICFFIPEAEAYLFTVSCLSSQYTYGRYFLLVSGVSVDDELAPHDTMGGNVRYSFSLLQHGECLQGLHPIVTPLSMSKRGDEVTGNVTMRMSIEKTNADADLLFYCISEDHRIISHANRTLCVDRRKKTVSVNFFTSDIWVKGSYRIYMLHNGEPFALAECYYDGNMFSVSSMRNLVIAENDYFFAKYMLFGEYAESWRLLANMPGYTAGKQHVISTVSNLVMNSYRNKRHLKTIYGHCNYILNTFDKGFLNAFVPLVTSCRIYDVGDCASLVEQCSTSGTCDAVNEFFSGSCDVVVLNNVGALAASSAKAVLARIETWLKSDNNNSLFLCGASSEVRMLFETSPVLQEFFPRENVVVHGSYTLAEQVHYMQKLFAEYDFYPTRDAEAQLLAYLTDAYRDGATIGWRADELKALFVESIYPRIRERVVAHCSADMEKNLKLLSTVLPEDLQLPPVVAKISTFDNMMSELNSMIGLKNLKQHFNTLFSNMRFHELRRAEGLAVPAITTGHMIFTGNPGTGKTTVAKMVGKIFKSLGLLSNGEVIITERARIVGRYIGETERNMQHLLEQARGNVLFIDEAYTLCDGANDRKDFGAHVIDSLLTVLSQPNPDILVIMAGYKKEMERMMLMNQGLEGRFPYKYHFDDYSVDELMQIADNLFAKNDYTLSPSARIALYDGITDVYNNKDEHFSNARWVGQLVADGIIPAMSTRVLSGGGIVNRETLTLVHCSDVAVALERFGCKKPEHKPRRCVGFL